MTRRATLLLTERDVWRVADYRLAIGVTRQAFAALARGQAVMPPKVYLPLPRQSDFRAMPAYVARPSACGIKWVNVHPGNRRRGLPTVMAVLVLNDPATGAPIAVMDGLAVTKLRTAAAAAVAAQTLARRDSRVVGLVGCGAQGEAQLLALREVLPVRMVRVWGHARGEAAAFCRRLRGRLPGIVLEPVGSVRACVERADVVVTITSSRRPLVRRARLAPGTHVNAVGADAPGKQELEARILREACVVVDDRAQATHGGELNVPVRRGEYHPRAIHASLGEIIIKRRAGRRDPKQLTVFDSTGLAIHDVALGAAIVRLATRRHLGRRLQFFLP